MVNINIFNNRPKPNYIPVKNMQDFNYDVYAYYNQYYAPAAVTQQRRILRNYHSNNQTIRQFNRNPFINNQGKIYNFLYTYSQNYMFVQDNRNNVTDMYIYINSGWCMMKRFKSKIDCKEFENIVKEYGLKKYENP